MTNATENQVLDTNEAAPIVAKKPALFKKLAQFQTPDGLIFETQKEAGEHVRSYLVVEAVAAVAALFTGTQAGKDADGNDAVVPQTLAEFLLASKAELVKAFDAAKVERAPVTEETKAKMKAARAKKEIIADPAVAADPVPEVVAEVPAAAEEY